MKHCFTRPVIDIEVSVSTLYEVGSPVIKLVK
jgi:hypothetical protein